MARLAAPLFPLIMESRCYRSPAFADFNTGILRYRHISTMTFRSKFLRAWFHCNFDDFVLALSCFDMDIGTFFFDPKLNLIPD